MYNYKYYKVTVLTIRSSPIIFPTLSPPPSPHLPINSSQVTGRIAPQSHTSGEGTRKHIPPGEKENHRLNFVS